MNKYSLLPLIAVVFLAGCTAIPGFPTGGGVANGVIIKSFRPDISEIYSGDTVTFSVTLENVGGEDASDVSVKLFGLGNDWSPTLPFTETVGELTKSQPQYDIPGGMTDIVFDSVTSPSGLTGDATYTAGLRLTYNYTTTAEGKLKVYDYNYLKTLAPSEADRIMKSSALESFTVTSAPVTISLGGVARPLVYREDGSKTATVTIQISNVGQGYSYTGTSPDDTINLRKVRINSIELPNIDSTCQSIVGTEKTIPRDGKASFGCKFTMPSVASFQTVPIKIRLTYSYYIDSSSTIRVLQEMA